MYAYPRVDSLVWSAPGAPAISRVLGFDPDQGVITYVAGNDVPGRIDLRLGDVERAGSKFKLSSAAAADAAAIYGVAEGKAVRFTPTGHWELDTEAPVARVFPQADGSLIAMSRREGGVARLWRVFPPETELLDSARVTGLRTGPHIQAGDRLYLGTDEGFAVLGARTLDPHAPIELGTAPLDAVATPSGDRLFIAVEGETELLVYDRYRNQVGGRVALPGPARAVRIDPIGRYLLVRPASGDSAWIVAVGTLKKVGAVRTAWRTDLPFVAQDGAIATAQGEDVVFIDGATLRPTARAAGGAADYWFPFQWTGFRPRAQGLDQPVEFQIGTSDSAADSALAAAAAAADSGAAPAPTPPGTQPAPQPQPQPAPAQPRSWIVSFASVASEASARTIAEQVTVDGQRARVETTLRDGIPFYRVVLGPYPQREAAERVGRASGRPYWVFAAQP